MQLSVIIPVLNEAARITARLSELDRMSGVHEVIVADGGSTDATVELVRRAPQTARLIETPTGRAAQMNAGARAATGNVLLFLHADCQLPADAAGHVSRALQSPRAVGGAFKTWTVPDDDSGRAAPWLHLADIRSRYTRLPYGDQALFVRRDVFESVGGYPEQPLMEDLELVRRLSKRGRLVRVPARVRVSGRRFLSHPIRDTLLVNIFPLLYRAGVRPETLKRFYDDIR